MRRNQRNGGPQPRLVFQPRLQCSENILSPCLSVSPSLPHYTVALNSIKTRFLETEASGMLFFFFSLFFSQPPTDVLEAIIFSAVEQR